MRGVRIACVLPFSARVGENIKKRLQFIAESIPTHIMRNTYTVQTRRFTHWFRENK